MPKQPWMQAIILGGTVLVSLLVGSFLTLSIVDDDDPAATPSPTATAELPVAATVSPSQTSEATPTVNGSAAVLAADLPAVIEASAPSVVDIDLLAPNGVTLTGGGSGVVIDKDGHILTNWHVVNAAIGPIQVNLYDGTAAIATVLGSDRADDLAILKIDVDPGSLIPATFGDSGAVRIGEVVFAIGSPFDQDFTVTAGIISAKGRRSENSSPFRANPNLLQTDAAINPGNSGGPLFNLDGEVIGINVSINTTDGDFDGLAFAIPSNTVVRSLPQLIADEPIVHPQLGVLGDEIDAVDAARLDLKVTRGVLVASVSGGAAAAGILGGDVIIEIDGHEIRSLVDLVTAIDANEAGDTVPVVVNRDGRELTLQATLQPWQQ